MDSRRAAVGLSEVVLCPVPGYRCRRCGSETWHVPCRSCMLARGEGMLRRGRTSERIARATGLSPYVLGLLTVSAGVDREQWTFLAQWETGAPLTRLPARLEPQTLRLTGYHGAAVQASMRRAKDRKSKAATH